MGLFEGEPKPILIDGAIDRMVNDRIFS